METTTRIGARALARRLDINAKTLFRWVQAGRFPAPIYIGRAKKWDLAVVEEWERAEQTRPRPSTLASKSNLVLAVQGGDRRRSACRVLKLANEVAGP